MSHMSDGLRIAGLRSPWKLVESELWTIELAIPEVHDSFSVDRNLRLRRAQAKIFEVFRCGW